MTKMNIVMKERLTENRLVVAKVMNWEAGVG